MASRFEAVIFTTFSWVCYQTTFFLWFADILDDSHVNFVKVENYMWAVVPETPGIYFAS